MINNLVNLVGTIFQPSYVKPTQQVKTYQDNPFANPFITQSKTSNPFHGKNKPVFGGYFAGYHNGKPNIVGKRLFIEA